jgi:hypothetical protein
VETEVPRLIGRRGATSHHSIQTLSLRQLVEAHTRRLCPIQFFYTGSVEPISPKLAKERALVQRRLLICIMLVDLMAHFGS